MIGIPANKRSPSSGGIFSPLRYAVFRRIWTASLLSNLGILVLGVGAAWTMTQISSSTNLVALVQTSLMLPVALVSTPAGAIADMFDRRIVGIVALAIALTGSISLSIIASLGVVTPVLLLVSCFIIGSGMALFGPAWQASVSEQVPAEALPSAVALNGISYNIAAALVRRSAASLSRRRVRSPHSPRMRSSICRFSSSCFSGDGRRNRRGCPPNDWRERSYRAFATSYILLLSELCSGGPWLPELLAGQSRR